MKYSFEELKKLAKSFIDRLPTASVESADSGWHMFGVAYLNTEMTELQRESEGPALHRIIHREYESRLLEVA